MTDEDFTRIAETIANKSGWASNTDNWTRIYQAARAGAVLCDTAISGQRADHDVALGEHAFGAGFDAGCSWSQDGKPGHNAEAKHAAWSDYDPPEHLKGGGRPV